jgi:RHS repeat-associated protein
LGARLERHYQYDADGHLTRQGVKNGTGWLFDTQYQYDASGNLTVRRDSALGTDVYEYDPLSQLLQHTDPQGQLERFFQDPAGDRLQLQLRETSDGWSREGEYAGLRYGFDRAGQLTRRGNDSASTALTWDARQRLVQSETGGVATRYGYDPMGRRVWKQTGAAITHFCWDGNALLGEKDDVRGAREYVYYPDTFEPAALVDHAKQTFFYSNDPNGSPTRVLAASGEVVWAARYTASGSASIVIGDASFNPLRLQGQYADVETGLHYNRHRYYDPVIGQFISPDPIGLLAGTNLYRYGPNALTWIDPLGFHTHYLTAWIERYGQVLPDSKLDVESGGLTKDEAGRYGLKSHTEPKYLSRQAKNIDAGDVVHMQGRLDPCAPGCQPLLRDLAEGTYVRDAFGDTAPPTRTVYHASETGRTWTFRQAVPGEFGSAKAEVVQEVIHANGAKTVRRYWRNTKGGWKSKAVKVGCG